MDLLDAVVRSFLLSFLTLFIFASGADPTASAASTASPPTLQSNESTSLPSALQNNATMTVANTGATQTIIGTDGTPTELPTSLVTDLAMTTAPTENPGDVTTMTESADTTSSQETTTSTTEKPSGKSGFRVGTFFCVIILIGCLIGIGFCGYQFYRKRQNDNYHTL